MWVLYRKMPVSFGSCKKELLPDLILRKNKILLRT